MQQPGDGGLGSFAPFVGSAGAGPSNLPALVGARPQELGGARDAVRLVLPFGAHPEKLLKTNNGMRATSTRITAPQAAFLPAGAPSTPPAHTPVQLLATEQPQQRQMKNESSPGRAGLNMTYRADLALFPRSFPAL